MLVINLPTSMCTTRRAICQQSKPASPKKGYFKPGRLSSSFCYGVPIQEQAFVKIPSVNTIGSVPVYVSLFGVGLIYRLTSFELKKTYV